VTAPIRAGRDVSDDRARAFSSRPRSARSQCPRHPPPPAPAPRCHASVMVGRSHALAPTCLGHSRFRARDHETMPRSCSIPRPRPCDNASVMLDSAPAASRRCLGHSRVGHRARPQKARSWGTGRSRLDLMPRSWGTGRSRSDLMPRAWGAGRSRLDRERTAVASMNRLPAGSSQPRAPRRAASPLETYESPTRRSCRAGHHRSTIPRPVRIHPGRPGVNPTGSYTTRIGGRFIAVDCSPERRHAVGSIPTTRRSGHDRSTGVKPAA
jgi:hypothetical protein